nr:hypothetical protein CFP56_02526 [Quercus suber]
MVPYGRSSSQHSGIGTDDQRRTAYARLVAGLQSSTMRCRRHEIKLPPALLVLLMTASPSSGLPIVS